MTEFAAIPEETLAHAVRAARLKVAFAGHPASLTLAIVLATLTLGVLWPSGDAVALIAWYLCFLVVAALRLSLFLAYRSVAATASPQTFERLQTKLVLACGAAGASWGLASLIAFPESPLLVMFLSFVMAGVSAAAVASLSSIRAAALSFVLACALPLAARLLSTFETTQVAMSVMVLLFVVLVGTSATRLDAQLLALVRSRLEADEHLRARNEKHAQLEALNDRLRLSIQAGIAELERVDRMKSEFVSIVSHELRTPLTSMRAALGLVVGGGAGPIADKAQQLLQLASRNAERLGVLVDDMLDMERIESGKLQFELAPRALQPIVEQALAVNGAHAAARKVSLRLVASAPSAIVAVDASRLLQVMTNLLSNAVKFSPPDACVEIELRESGSAATIEVRDRGPGIAPGFQPKLFSKFSQGDSSDARAQGGSGLGLAISKALIEQMHGRIHFRTDATGTSFFIDLPLLDMNGLERVPAPRVAG